MAAGVAALSFLMSAAALWIALLSLWSLLALIGQGIPLRLVALDLAMAIAVVILCCMAIVIALNSFPTT